LGLSKPLRKRQMALTLQREKMGLSSQEIDGNTHCIGEFSAFIFFY
jgi:hypothetical protein